jgi:hypothetical protein
MNFRILLLAAAIGLLLLAVTFLETLLCLAGQVWGLHFLGWIICFKDSIRL